MPEQRKDRDTAQQLKEAQAMQRAFGADAAATFLSMRHVDPELARRVLEQPERRRQF